MNETEIDKYLFNEMKETEREQFEDKIVGDDTLFYEIAERENELVDLYSSGKLAGDERRRFESTLAGLPARRQKIANAEMLQEFIVAEKAGNRTITIAERSGYFSRFFSFAPAVQFASVGLILVLGFASIYLWTENRRLGSLELELAASRQREIELAQRTENDGQASSDLTVDLNAERERTAKLEAEIAKLRKSNDRAPINAVPTTIATLVLSSVIRKGGPAPTHRLELGSGVGRVSMVIGIPVDAAFSERVSIVLNGERVAQNVNTRVRNGEKSVAITISAEKLKTGSNELVVHDSKGVVAATYFIAVAKSQ